jgi:Fibronectin type III domain
VGPTRSSEYMRRLIQVPVLATLLALVCASVATASTITVTRTDDPTGDQNCLGADTSCSLRQAISAENGMSSGGDTIVLGAGTYSLTQGTDIIATKSFDLQGAGVASTTIDGSKNASSATFNPLARILRVDSGATVVIQGVTFTGGYDEQDEGCSSGCSTINSWGGGDLLNNGGNVTLDGVAFANNYSSATPLGGAVSNGSGSLTMNDVSFTHNAAGAGGALFTRSGTVSGNGVTFSSNATTCCEGGAAYLLGGTVTLVNTTIASSGGFDAGGAIANGGANLTLDNVTLDDSGSDIQTDQSASTTVENTILAVDSGGTACVAAGRPDSLNDQTTGPAITTDGGNNIGQDNSCGLQASTDKSKVDPHVAPLFDNGGPTLTQALLAGSPALGDPATTNCPARDQRGVARGDGSCDIGAFEAVIKGAPTTPTTGTAQNLTSTSADLTAMINLSGEAGGFHFLYGTSSDPANWTSTAEAAAGVVSSDTSETETVSGLSPATKYYYTVVADDASGSTQAASQDVQQFTTRAAPPQISNVSAETPTDSTAKIDFTIDPQGTDTGYMVKYGPDTNYGLQTDPVDIGSTAGPQQLSATLTHLTPGTTYHFDVVATNSGGSADAGDSTFDTAPQIAGTVGHSISIGDSGDSNNTCPSAPTVDWADGHSDQAQISCTSGPEDDWLYQTSDGHTYTAPGHYVITIAYDDLGLTVTRYAQIAPASPPSNPTPPATTQPPSGPPTVGGGAPSTRTSTGAAPTGTVNPEGVATQAYFEYGLDLAERGPGADTTLYDQRTPAQTVGTDTTNHTVTASLTGLIPGALYHVRLVATNSVGTTFGADQTFTTAAAPAPPPPVLGQSQDVKPISGTVFIKTKNGQFIPLTGATRIPSGTVIDALHGSLQLLAALGKGKTEQGIFGGAVFRVTQAHNGLTNLTLIEAAFKGAPSYALCHAHKAADATTASSKTLQLLKASAHGKFRTTGRYSAATVRGTTWTIADRCDGTLTHDITHSVAVTDFVRDKTIILHAGQSYLAKPHTP